MINEYLWDYMIDNVNILDDDKNVFFAPLISNGIPSVELFIRDFCSKEEQEELYNIFENTPIPNLWGANYSHLNHPKLKEKWDEELFYDLVKQINHYYKGIHPVRISFKAQMRLAEIIVNNLEKFFSKQDYSLEILKRPYFCNSIYFIKTQVWKNIVNDNSLMCDGFDEVPLNQYKDRHDLNMVFVKNGYCVHMAYNTIKSDQRVVENYYYENFIPKIND
jgi:hypothetical protein